MWMVISVIFALLAAGLWGANRSLRRRQKDAEILRESADSIRQHTAKEKEALQEALDTLNRDYAQLLRKFSLLWWSNDHVKQAYIAQRFGILKPICDTCKQYMKPNDLHFGLETIVVNGCKLPDAVCGKCITKQKKGEYQ